MKTALSILSAISFLGTTGMALAQGTAFTYQGRLNDGTSPANGSYDLTFSLWNASSGPSQIGGTITNGAMGVSNGLFTLTLDFENQFPGAGRWLQIGVRTNGGGAFTILSPRQQITSTPYAVQAANASSVAAGNITGTIGLGQLPTAVVTNGTSGVNFTGTFSGNGGGLSNIPGVFPQQFASGTNLSAQVNTVYNLTNSAHALISMPTNANVGDVIQINALGSGGWGAQLENCSLEPAGLHWSPHGINTNWASVSMSADGSKMFAASSSSGRINTSSDSGTNWATAGNSLPGPWNSVACSADGTKAVAAMAQQLYISTNGGSSWAVGITMVATNFVAVVISADGSRMVAVGRRDLFFTGFDSVMLYSQDGGATWSPLTNAPKAGWNCIAMSADGSRLIAAAGWTTGSGTQLSPLWISTDYGLTWSAHGPTNFWTSLASSADGARLRAVGNGNCYTSDDFGASWVARTNGLPAVSFYSIACSSNGTRLVMAGFNTQFYTSPDSGLTWAGHGPTNNWPCVASSSAGTTLAAAPISGQIHTSLGFTQLEGTQGTSTEFRYNANGQWEAVSLPYSTGNSPDTVVSRDENGSFSAGTITATSFVGNGSGLTALDASKITGGTLADARLSANVSLLGQSIESAEITDGTIVDADISGVAGISDTKLATISTANKVADSALSLNVALRAGGNTFSGNQSFTAGTIDLDNTQAVYAKNTGGTPEVFLWPRYADNATYLNFGSGGFYIRNFLDVPVMSMRTNGNVGIGTVNPNANTLQINTNYHFASGYALQANKADYGANIQINRPAGQAGIGLVVDNSANGDANTHVLLVRNNVASAAQDLLTVRADGNVGIGTSGPTNKLHVAGGITCTALTQTSDRNAKENFAPVSPQEVLDKVTALPITTWNFKDLKDGRHMGPMAQDFYAAFGLGGGETTITSVDPDGVALAAIQGLNEKLEARGQKLERENADLKRQLEEIKAALNKLSATKN